MASQFTGSLDITGSLYVNGVSIPDGSWPDVPFYKVFDYQTDADYYTSLALVSSGTYNYYATGSGTHFIFTPNDGLGPVNFNLRFDTDSISNNEYVQVIFQTPSGTGTSLSYRTIINNANSRNVWLPTATGTTGVSTTNITRGTLGAVRAGITTANPLVFIRRNDQRYFMGYPYLNNTFYGPQTSTSFGTPL